MVFKALKKNENKSYQVDILLVLTDVGVFFEKSPSEQIRFNPDSVCTGDTFADTFGAQQKSPMLFLLTQEIIKMWNKLFVCKLCKTLKDSLERRKGKKNMHLHMLQSWGCWKGAKFKPHMDDKKQIAVAPNISVQTLGLCLKVLDSVGFYCCI